MLSSDFKESVKVPYSSLMISPAEEVSAIVEEETDMVLDASGGEEASTGAAIDKWEDPDEEENCGKEQGLDRHNKEVDVDHTVLGNLKVVIRSIVLTVYSALMSSHCDRNHLTFSI